MQSLVLRYISAGALALLVAGTTVACHRQALINAEEHLIPPSARMLDDPNIVGMTLDSDSAEVVLARAVQGKLTDPRFRQFAQTLIDDHSRSMNEMHSLARQLNIEVDRPPIDTIPTETRHLLDRFNGMAPGQALDTAFVNHEVRDHHMDLGDTQSMAEWAKNPQLKDALTRSLPVLEKHLRMAEALGGHA